MVFVSGCVSTITFEPSELADAKFGTPYWAEVNIIGGAGPVVDLTYEITPINSVLALKFKGEIITQTIYIIIFL